MQPVPEYPGQRIKGRESLLKVAAIQMEPHVGDLDYNLQVSSELIGRAIRDGVKLMVLPELCSSGYMFNSRAEVAEIAQPVPGGPTVEAWQQLARAGDCYIVGGVAERDGGRFYNTAAFVGPDGYIGKYRKIHLWDEEKLFFEPGDLGLPIFHTPFGRVGIMICYDGWHPEVARILALQGADIICDPTCWVLVEGLIDLANPISPWVHAAAAHVNGVYMICADRCGTERSCTFLGNSCVLGPTGFVVDRASLDRQEIVCAEINLSAARYHNWSELANPVADRRIDVYDRLLGYRSAAPGR
ncbi:MAG: nitrilase family protein [Chloroflexi bacterium]|nr:nitrilase family protein [Chloroflexota bacterium]